MKRIRPRNKILCGVMIGYLFLLIVSHGVRRAGTSSHQGEALSRIQLPEFDGQRATSRRVSISFDDSGGEGPVLILLHERKTATDHLSLRLSQNGRFRVLTPVFPEFEGSDQRLVDYSIVSQASYVSAWLDTLGIEKAHFIGYGMSGGVVAELMESNPDRLSSVTLLSAVGVQELELMGDYSLNRLAYALQYGVLWTISEGFPHFGAFDRAPYGVEYARNLLDSDQRHLRDYMIAYQNPVLIVHGDQDYKVPYATALEHHRIIPQSELITFPEWGHKMPFQHPDVVASVILEWISRVELHQAVSRSAATFERLEQAELPFNARDLPPLEGVGLVILLVIIATTTFLSEDLAAIGAGLLVARGSLEFEVALMATFVGIFAGDIGLYLAGRTFGARIVSMPPFSWIIRPEKLERGKAWFAKEGAKVVLLSRVLPGSRFPTYVAAGILKAPFWKFVGLFFLGTVIWTPLIVGGSTFMGNQILSAWALYESYALWVVLGLLLIMYGMYRFGIRNWIRKHTRWS